MGTVIEWYDFFVFGTLAAVIAANFTAGSDSAGFIFALGAFAAGFIVRPFGALFFGRMGDRVGRKRAFLVTISLMGAATVAIGLLPSIQQAGMWAPALLVLTRVLQGFAMGGEYGGAAVYVAEHAAANRRGYLTGWIQLTAATGLVLALATVLATRLTLGETQLRAWGWRIPFLLSAVLLALSLWIRASLAESPVFQHMREAGLVARSPIWEAFRGDNLRRIVMALVCILLAQGAVWYTAHFYAQFFLERVLKVDPLTVNVLVMLGVLVSCAGYVMFGWLSDRVGRKPVMLCGMIVAAAAYLPGFHYLAAYANPGLQQASEHAPITVSADPADCHFQFDPFGRQRFDSSCDLARRILSDTGVPYHNVPGAKGLIARVDVAGTSVPSVSVAGLDSAQAATERRRVGSELRAALRRAGYPPTADPSRLNAAAVLAILVVFMLASAALYGPQAAALVELFPTRVRATALSVPYNIGTGWIGGLLPVSAFAMVAATGNIYFGLTYPLVFTLVGIGATLAFFPETNGRSLVEVEIQPPVKGGYRAV